MNNIIPQSINDKINTLFTLVNRVYGSFVDLTSNYFFIDIPLESCINQILTYNLDVHRQSIISGEFPLKFLNRKFIEEQRLQLEEIYEKSHKKIKYDKMINSIKDYIENNKVL